MEIVFDTNAYLAIVKDKSMDQVRKEFAAITGTEEGTGFKVRMAPVPWMELFCHLTDQTDPKFEDSMRAVVASVIHSRRDFRTGQGNLVPQWQMMVTNALFQHRDEALEKSLYSLDNLACVISRTPNIPTVNINHSYLQGIRDFSEKKKYEFGENVKARQGEYHGFPKSQRDLIKRQFNKDDVYIMALNSILVQAAQECNLKWEELDFDTWMAKLTLIAKYFPAPVFLIRGIISKVMGQKEFNIEKNHRKNWYWDYQMLFYISSETTYILVTDDGAMKDAAKEAGVGDRVMGLNEYIKLLKLNIKTEYPDY